MIVKDISEIQDAIIRIENQLAALSVCVAYNDNEKELIAIYYEHILEINKQSLARHTADIEVFESKYIR